MITLHLLEHLRLNGFGTAIDTDLFFEKLPLGKNGIAIYSVGGERPYGARSKSQLFELESRGRSDLLGMHNLEKIAEHFAAEQSQVHKVPHRGYGEHPEPWARRQRSGHIQADGAYNLQ
jgi:hypothetical protein